MNISSLALRALQLDPARCCLAPAVAVINAYWLSSEIVLNWVGEVSYPLQLLPSFLNTEMDPCKHFDFLTSRSILTPVASGDLIGRCSGACALCRFSWAWDGTGPHTCAWPSHPSRAFFFSTFFLGGTSHSPCRIGFDEVQQYNATDWSLSTVLKASQANLVRWLFALQRPLGGQSRLFSRFPHPGSVVLWFSCSEAACLDT